MFHSSVLFRCRRLTPVSVAWGGYEYCYPPPTPPGWNANPWQFTPQHPVGLSQQMTGTHLCSWGEERHYDSEESCPTEHNADQHSASARASPLTLHKLGQIWIRVHLMKSGLKKGTVKISLYTVSVEFKVLNDGSIRTLHFSLQFLRGAIFPASLNYTLPSQRILDLTERFSAWVESAEQSNGRR